MSGLDLLVEMAWRGTVVLGVCIRAGVGGVASLFVDNGFLRAAGFAGGDGGGSEVELAGDTGDHQARPRHR